MSLNENLQKVSDVIGQPIQVEWRNTTGLWRVHSPGAYSIHGHQGQGEGALADTPEGALRGFVEHLRQYQLDLAETYAVEAAAAGERASDLEALLG